MPILKDRLTWVEKSCDDRSLVVSFLADGLFCGGSFRQRMTMGVAANGSLDFRTVSPAFTIFARANLADHREKKIPVDEATAAPAEVEQCVFLLSRGPRLFIIIFLDYPAVKGINSHHRVCRCLLFRSHSTVIFHSSDTCALGFSARASLPFLTRVDNAVLWLK